MRIARTLGNFFLRPFAPCGKLNGVPLNLEIHGRVDQGEERPWRGRTLGKPGVSPAFTKSRRGGHCLQARGGNAASCSLLPLAGARFCVGKQSGGLYTCKPTPVAQVSSSRETI